jgi:hypothetical protein
MDFLFPIGAERKIRMHGNITVGAFTVTSITLHEGSGLLTGKAELLTGVRNQLYQLFRWGCRANGRCFWLERKESYFNGPQLVTEWAPMNEVDDEDYPVDAKEFIVRAIADEMAAA